MKDRTARRTLGVLPRALLTLVLVAVHAWLLLYLLAGQRGVDPALRFWPVNWILVLSGALSVVLVWTARDRRAGR